MFMRCLILTCIMSCVLADLEVDYHDNPDAPSNELPCTVIGGTCRDTGKCPQGTRVTTEGLCPYQENRGIQCCHSSKAKIVANPTCKSRGGECMDKSVECPINLTVRAAHDCQPDETCCVLIH